MYKSYPFIFQMNDYSGANGELEYTMQYRFKSEKSHHTYIVRIECYVDHTYCVKFYDKANTLSDNKFSLRTKTYEPRVIVNTVFNVMLDVLKKDGLASFFFIGVEDEKDIAGKATRRFLFFSDYVLSLVSDTLFGHFRANHLSLYILVNKKYTGDISAYVNRINDRVAAAMAL